MAEARGFQWVSPLCCNCAHALLHVLITLPDKPFCLFSDCGRPGLRVQLFDGEEGWVAYEKRFWFPSKQCGSDSPFYCAPTCPKARKKRSQGRNNKVQGMALLC